MVTRSEFTLPEVLETHRELTTAFLYSLILHARFRILYFRINFIRLSDENNHADRDELVGAG